MKQPNRIRVLAAFAPLLRLLKAFNRQKFLQDDQVRRRKSIFLALGVILAMAIFPIVILLAAWYLLENNGDLRMFAADGPIILSIVQFIVTFGVMCVKSREIDELVNRLQGLVDTRRLPHCGPINMRHSHENKRNFRLFAGCEDSDESREIYKFAEDKHSTVTAYLRERIRSDGFGILFVVSNVADIARNFQISATGIMGTAAGNTVDRLSKCHQSTFGCFSSIFGCFFVSEQ